MKAAVMRRVGDPLQIEDVVVDDPQAHEVVVRVAACGVCHSDLHVLHGHIPNPLPAVLGHEPAGIVEAVGSEVVGLVPGDHVVASLASFCGHCEFCVSGKPFLCRSPPGRGPDSRPRLSSGGEALAQFQGVSGFAEQILVHESSLVTIPPEMPLDRASIMGCGVVTGLGAVLNTAGVRAGASVAVFGCGGVGLSAIQGARIAGATTIIAIDVQPGKLKIAEEVGATHTIDSSSSAPVDAIMEIAPGGVEFSFEAIGRKDTAEAAFACLRPSGVATLIGFSPPTALELDPNAFLYDRTLRGSYMGSTRFKVDVPRYVDLYLQGRLNLDALVSQRVQLEQVADAFEALAQGAAARSVITFNGASA